MRSIASVTKIAVSLRIIEYETRDGRHKQKSVLKAAWEEPLPCLYALALPLARPYSLRGFPTIHTVTYTSLRGHVQHVHVHVTMETRTVSAEAGLLSDEVNLLLTQEQPLPFGAATSSGIGINGQNPKIDR